MKYIYIHKFPNGKAYIGSSSNPKARWYGKYNDEFEKAVSEFGWENVEHSIIASVDDDNALWLERRFMYKFNTIYPNGYNILETGQTDEEKDILISQKRVSSIKLSSKTRWELKIASRVSNKTVEEMLNEAAIEYMIRLLGKEKYEDLGRFYKE